MNKTMKKKNIKKVKVKTTTFNAFYFSSLLVSSYVIVAFGQPVWVGWLGYFAAFFGYALFWRAICFFKSKGMRFSLATLWFASVHGVGLSWMTETHYHGYFIVFVYLFLLLGVGVQFGLLSLLIVKRKSFTFLQMLAIASVWTIFEWLRLFFLSGYTWNPVGMALAANNITVQIASLFGIYGMSFWVILVNTMSFKVLFVERNIKLCATWCSLMIFPFIFGTVHFFMHKDKIDKEEFYSVVLVQTALLPEQKDPISNYDCCFISPVVQWERILHFINDSGQNKIDLIVFPESVVPFGARQTFYPIDSVMRIWENVFGKESIQSFPVLRYPLANKNEKKQWFVSNTFWAQALANYYETEVVIGLEDADAILKKNYNAAFFLQPFGFEAKRYKKQILVPIGEYFPFSWCKTIAAKFGISGQFTPGKDTKVFFGQKLPFGISICYEETYGDLIRKNRLKGARLFVNITNDVWFPNSTLPQQHYELGRLRAIENGIPIIRACNTGVTVAVDSLGRIVKKMKGPDCKIEEIAGAMHVKVPLHHFPTLYTLAGDKFILTLSFIFIGLFIKKEPKKFFYYINNNFKL